VEKIAIYNNKGGVGKSTISVMLAHGLAKLDYKVLLLDLDDQNNCSLFLGMDTDQYEKTFFDLLENPANFESCIYKARENLFILPNTDFRKIQRSIDLEDNEKRNIRTILSEKLQQSSNYNFDYIIIDCSPSMGTVNDSILYYTDRVLIPIQLEVASIKGIVSIYEHLERIGIDRSKLSLIIPNLMDIRTKEHKENLELVKANFKDMVTSPVLRRTKITESASQGLTIYEIDDVAQEQFYPILRRVVSG